MKFNLKRVRPERYEKRKLVTKGEELAYLKLRVPLETKTDLTTEACKLGISENLYINAIVETRSLSKVKKLLEDAK